MASRLDALANNKASPNGDRRESGRMMVEGLSCSQGKVLDLSSRGMRIVRTTRWRAGEIRQVSFPVLAGRTMVVAARCEWIRRTGFFKYTCGIEFLGLSDDHKEALRNIALTNAKRVWCGIAS